MGQVISFNMMTLDGFFEGKNQELDWHNVDEEFNRFAITQLNSVDSLIFGRKTYQLMEQYWPTKQAISNHPIMAKRMNTIEKKVFSKTLDTTNWENTNVLRNNVGTVVSELKNKSEKNVLILGSANLTQTLIRNGLIDLYRIMVNPVILGNGNPLFAGLKNRIDIELEHITAFKSGNVLMEYRPK